MILITRVQMIMMMMIAKTHVLADSKTVHDPKMSQRKIKGYEKKLLKMPNPKNEKIKYPNILKNAKKNKEQRRNKT